MNKILEYIQEANKITIAIDHLIYITLPIVKDKKILIKILIELKKATAYSINAILQYEYLKKRIQLYKEPKANFQVFLTKCASRYSLSEKEISEIKNLFEIIQKHEKSSVEFAKIDKLVIISDDKQTIITLEKSKEFLRILKKLLEEICKKMRKI